MLTLFTKSLPIDISTRIWDVYFVDGEIVVYLAIMGIMGQLNAHLLSLSFEGVIKTLSNLGVRMHMHKRTHTHAHTQDASAHCRQQHLNEDDLFEQIETLNNQLSVSRFQEICKLCT